MCGLICRESCTRNKRGLLCSPECRKLSWKQSRYCEHSAHMKWSCVRQTCNSMCNKAGRGKGAQQHDQPTPSRGKITKLCFCQSSRAKADHTQFAFPPLPLLVSAAHASAHAANLVPFKRGPWEKLTFCWRPAVAARPYIPCGWLQ